jgi:NADPH-dependent curcumin reductase CurA
MSVTSTVPGRMLAVCLRERPRGALTTSSFEVVNAPIPSPHPGEALVRVDWLSVDPYLRELLDEEAFITPFEVGQPLWGKGIGTVVRSDDPDQAPGSPVLGDFPWQGYACLPAGSLTRIDPGPLPTTAYLGALGSTGLAAYAGLTRIGGVKPGEVVYISAAAGAVGSVASQMARAFGCRAFGSAGSTAKVDWLREVARLDGVFDYKTEPPDQALGRLCPEGIDVYFDNVGGAQLGAVLRRMKRAGRVVLCGSIGEYDPATAGPLGLVEAVNRRLTLRGFLVSDHRDLLPEFRARMTGWVEAGLIRVEEQVTEGLENAPEALAGLFRGANLGKALIRVVHSSP